MRRKLRPKARRRRATEADLHPVSRAFWRKRGGLGKYPLRLLIALDKTLAREEAGWTKQLQRAFSE